MKRLKIKKKVIHLDFIDVRTKGRRGTFVFPVPTMASYKGRCRVPYLDPAKEQKGIEFQAFPPIHGTTRWQIVSRLVVRERRTLSNYVFLYVSSCTELRFV